jgi:hypothetical protein
VAGGAETGGEWCEDEFHACWNLYPWVDGITPVLSIGRKVRTFEPMSGHNVVVAGEKEAGTALESALRGLGVDARFLAAGGLTEALVGDERELELSRPDAAVAVGTGEGALALAITATKLGVPLATVPGTEGPADALRILATLADLDTGPGTDRAAGLIASWLDGNPPASDLD